MRTLLTVQSFSVYGPGGGPRILRSLLEDGPWLAISAAAGPVSRSGSGSIREHFLPTRRTFGRLESTRANKLLQGLDLAYVRSLSYRLAELAECHSVTAVHSVVHGLDFLAAYRCSRTRRLPLFLTIHDHPSYAFRGVPTRRLALRALAAPWRDAAHRYVISRELGEDMVRRYGPQPYSLATDGISSTFPPRQRNGSSRHVYFMGAFHHSYRPNFVALLRGLALYRDRHAAEVSLVLRGGAPPLSEQERMGVPVLVLPWGSQADIDDDLERADLLYFPLPFGAAHKDFVRFSLSTKLVTFLGSGLPICLHAPADSAAFHLLSASDAAVRIASLDPSAVAEALTFSPARARAVTVAAGALADRQFRIGDQRARFWRPLRELGGTE